MPLEAEDGGDEADGDGLAEERGEHERHGGEEPRRGAELGVPPAVEGRARGGGQRQRPPERRLQPAVPPPPRRRQVAARVVHAHVRRGRQAQPAPRPRPRRWIAGEPVAAWASLPWASAWPGIPGWGARLLDHGIHGPDTLGPIGRDAQTVLCY